MTNLIKSTCICTRIQNYVSYLKNFVDYKFHNYVKVLVKVLFSDNNSDVFEWNWLILGTLIDIYVRYCTKQELQLLSVLLKLSPLELG